MGTGGEDGAACCFPALRFDCLASGLDWSGGYIGRRTVRLAALRSVIASWGPCARACMGSVELPRVVRAASCCVSFDDDILVVF
jgi:hypothetical protein